MQKDNNNCDVGQSLISLEQALSELKSRVIPIERTEQVTLKESLGRVLAEDLVSKINVPPADNSAMDGYAIRVSDLTSEYLKESSKEIRNEFTVSQRICAGEVGDALSPHSVARIFTGAPIPEGRRCRGNAGKLRAESSNWHSPHKAST